MIDGAAALIFFNNFTWKSKLKIPYKFNAHKSLFSILSSFVNCQTTKKKFNVNNEGTETMYHTCSKLNKNNKAKGVNMLYDYTGRSSAGDSEEVWFMIHNNF